MSTTSLKLPDELKQAAALAAEQQGTTPHAFMVEAIRTATAAAKKRAAFVSHALTAREEVLKTGKAYVAEEVHAYIRARAQGQRVPRPKARNWRA